MKARLFGVGVKKSELTGNWFWRNIKRDINSFRNVFLEGVLPAKSKSFIDLLRKNSICALRLDHFLPKALCDSVTCIISFHQFPVSPKLTLPVLFLNQLPQTW